MPSTAQLLAASERLHSHLAHAFLRDGLLEGPDAGVRFNLRAWRFVKSALPFIPWRDRHIFLQTQGYWILCNWMLHEATGEEKYRALAIAGSDAILGRQQSEGCWRYPLPERRHLVATVEGNWGAVGLLASYARTGRRDFLDAAIRWYDFLTQRIGFQAHSEGKAINYFDRPRGKIPNNSVEALWFFLRLWKTTADDRYRQHVRELGDFITGVQLPSGELPYIVDGPLEPGREHYLCFQYNAFQFMKLAWAAEIDPCCGARRVLPSLAAFLGRGVTATGAAKADCFRTRPEVDYYTAALAAALHEASRIGVAPAGESSRRCYERVLQRQRRNGSFSYSSGDYGFLADSRSYPRPEAMTLFHLLLPVAGGILPT